MMEIIRYNDLKNVNKYKFMKNAIKLRGENWMI